MAHGVRASHRGGRATGSDVPSDLECYPLVQDLFVQWVTAYGPFAIYGPLVLGIFGLPVPDETLLTFAGVLISQGKLRLLPTITAAFLGSVVGITLSYLVGRLVGLPVLHRYGRLFHLTPEAVDKVQAWFQRVGKWALTFGYFIPGVRHLTALVAGASDLRVLVFASFAYAGAFLWSMSFIALGYYVGDRWSTVVGELHGHLVQGAVIAVAVVAAYVLIRRTMRPTR